MTFIKLEAEHGSVNPAQIAYISHDRWKPGFQYRVSLVCGDCLYLDEENLNLLVLELGL